MLRNCFLVLIVQCGSAFSQSFETRVGVNLGLNGVLVGARAASWFPGQSTSLSGAFVFKPEKQPLLRLCVAASYAYHAFNSKANKFLVLSYPQASWCLSLQGGLRLKKHLTLKAGLFAQYGVPDNKDKLFLTDRTGTGAYTKGFEDLYSDYQPSLWQVGAQCGATLGLGEKEIVALEIQLLQYASKISDSDYYLVRSFPPADRQLLISCHARPTVLLAGINFRISRERIKPERQPEEVHNPWLL